MQAAFYDHQIPRDLCALLCGSLFDEIAGTFFAHKLAKIAKENIQRRAARLCFRVKSVLSDASDLGL